MSDTCSMCFYSEEYKFLSSISTNIMGDDIFKCIHPNSPFANEIVRGNDSCRLFMNEKEYFFMKDRKEKIENLKNKSRHKRL